MKKQGYRPLCYWLLMLFCTFIAAFSQTKAQQKTSTDDWVQKNYAGALETVFQNVCAPLASPKGARWTACIHITPAFRHERETIVYLEKSYEGTIEARASRAKDQSIYDQLLSLRQENPNASLPDLCRLVQVSLLRGDQRRFPKLLELSNEFEKLQISLALSDELISDPTKYYLHVRSYTGNELDVTLYGSETNLSQKSDALLRWEYEVSALLTKEEK